MGVSLAASSSPPCAVRQEHPYQPTLGIFMYGPPRDEIGCAASLRV